MKQITIGIMIGMVIVLAVIALIFGQRLYHNYKRDRETVNTYAIQNVKTGLDIRPYNAGIADGNKIIQYHHHEWQCVTWQMIHLSDGRVLLKNLYTQKTIQPSGKPETGATLIQKPLEANKDQYWEFILNDKDNYNIRLCGTDLFMTAESKENNAPLILKKADGSASQLWRLVEQHPVI